MSDVQLRIPASSFAEKFVQNSRRNLPAVRRDRGRRRGIKIIRKKKCFALVKKKMNGRTQFPLCARFNFLRRRKFFFSSEGFAISPAPRNDSLLFFAALASPLYQMRPVLCSRFRGNSRRAGGIYIGERSASVYTCSGGAAHKARPMKKVDRRRKERTRGRVGGRGKGTRRGGRPCTRRRKKRG